MRAIGGAGLPGVDRIWIASSTDVFPQLFVPTRRFTRPRPDIANSLNPRKPEIRRSRSMGPCYREPTGRRKLALPSSRDVGAGA